MNTRASNILWVVPYVSLSHYLLARRITNFHHRCSPCQSITAKPIVLVFTQRSVDGGLKKIKEKATVHQAHYSKPGEPANLFRAHPSARAIWIAEAEIALAKHAALSRQVVDYARDGGTVVLGGYFPSHIRPDDFRRWVSTAWGLPWHFGQYERTTAVFQSGATGRGENKRWRDGLAAAYSCKCVFFQNVAATDSWYASPEGARS